MLPRAHVEIPSRTNSPQVVYKDPTVRPLLRVEPGLQHLAAFLLANNTPESTRCAPVAALSVRYADITPPSRLYVAGRAELGRLSRRHLKVYPVGKKGSLALSPYPLHLLTDTKEKALRRRPAHRLASRWPLQSTARPRCFVPRQSPRPAAPTPSFSPSPRGAERREPERKALAEAALRGDFHSDTPRSAASRAFPGRTPATPLHSASSLATPTGPSAPPPTMRGQPRDRVTGCRS